MDIARRTAWLTGKPAKTKTTKTSSTRGQSSNKIQMIHIESCMFAL